MERNIKRVTILLLFVGLARCGDGGSEQSEPADSGVEEIPCPGEPGDEGCACVADGGCDPGLVCDESSGLCRDQVNCNELGCAELCQPAVGDRDARCVSTCDAGFAPNTKTGVCEPYEANCILGAVGSIAIECEESYRVCEDSGDTVHCGACYFHYVEESGACRPVKTCDELECLASNHSCTKEGDHSDAVCGGCLPGYADQGGNCASNSEASCEEPAVDGSIRGDCETAHSVCVESIEEVPAHCGECLEGFVLNAETGLCEEKVGCDALSCEASNMECAPTPNAHCAGCVEGYLPSRATGVCEKIRTCADLSCPEGTVCEPEFSNQHAFCWDDHDCESDQLWDPKKQVCIQCPVCGDQDGESTRRWPRLTKGTDRCICATLDGYFFSDATDLQIYPCDADQDGWVRKDAQASLEKEEGTPIRMNARCDLRAIDRFIFINVNGVETSVFLEPLGVMAYLYEPTLLDEDQHVEEHPKEFPPYGPDGRVLHARELNPLTKACVDPLADYNNNGVADVNEWQQVSDEYVDLTEVQQFMPYSYFIELHRGWYQPGKYVGVYYIQEKARYADAEPGEQVPLTYPDADDQNKQYWQYCDVYRDSAYNPDPEVSDLGMDFARYTEAEMNHHSQFKCLIASQTDPSAEEAAAKPTTMSRSTMQKELYIMNRCTTEAISQLPTTGEGELNPWDPEISCEVLDYEDITPGTVGFGVVGYIDYKDRSDTNPDARPSYVRGCLNECAEMPEICPGNAPDDESTFQMTCDGQTGDFGRISCGCGEVFGYGDYGDGTADGRCASFGCPGHVSKSPEWTPEDRHGFWVCHQMTGAADTSSDTDSGYEIRGNFVVHTDMEATGANYTIKNGSFRGL